LNLGRLGYRQALSVQEKHHEFLQKVVAGQSRREDHPNTLILVEHDPVYTIGIRTGDYPESEEKRLKDLGADFLRTNRGGLITFHGPGQLVAYPVISLADFPVVENSIRCYVRKIEETIISSCKNIFSGTSSPNPDVTKLEVSTMEGYPGVWVNSNRKIAAIGVHAANGVTMHGLAFNCNTDLKWYDHIVPCGIQGKGITSISKELKQDFTIGQTIPYFLESIREVFQCDLVLEDLDDTSRNGKKASQKG
jgi:lipoyl(octanoyl) transferase